jgi:WD40 repeat protein
VDQIRQELDGQVGSRWSNERVQRLAAAHQVEVLSATTASGKAGAMDGCFRGVLWQRRRALCRASGAHFLQMAAPFIAADGFNSHPVLLPVISASPAAPTLKSDTFNPVNRVVLTPSGRIVVATFEKFIEYSTDNTLVTTFPSTGRFTGHANVTDLAYLDDDRIFTSFENHSVTHFTRLRCGADFTSFPVDIGPCMNCLSLSPHRRFLAAGSDSGSVRLLPLPSGSPLYSLAPYPAHIVSAMPIRALVWSVGAAEFLFTGSQDGAVHIMRVCDDATQ